MTHRHRQRTARPCCAPLLLDGVPAREARERAAVETGLPRREVYRLWLSVQREL